MLEFRVLGPLEVRSEGQVLDLGGQKQRALLALLLLADGNVVSTDRLVDSLWGERPPRTAVTSLHNFVSGLRKLLGPETIETRPPGYRLHVAPGAVDAARAGQLLEQAREADPATQAALLREALDLWNGTPLADLAFQSFSQPDIARLEELRLTVLERRIDADLRLGRRTDLVGELETLVAAYPLRERFAAHLMLALYRSGRQVEALDVFQRLRRDLVDELGIEPGPELRELHASVLRHEPGLEVGTHRAAASEDRYRGMARALASGRLVVVIGHKLADEASGPPTELELAESLARTFEYPERPVELPRVSQYVATLQGAGPLHDELHELLGEAREGTGLQRLLARAAARLAELGRPAPLVVSSSYDRSLERAFADEGVEADVVAYLAVGPDRGRYVHCCAGGETVVVHEPNRYEPSIGRDGRPTILRVAGQVDADPARRWESFVVTEDDYLGYLSSAAVTNPIPVGISARLRRSHLLFVGFALRDWPLRALFHILWGSDQLAYRSWAAVDVSDALERDLWRSRNVEVIDVEPVELAQRLAACLDEELGSSRR